MKQPLPAYDTASATVAERKSVNHGSPGSHLRSLHDSKQQETAKRDSALAMEGVKHQIQGLGFDSGE